MNISDSQASQFESHDFHDALVVEVRILPAIEPGESSSVEVTFDHNEETHILSIYGCANLSLGLDLDVLAENLYMNVLGLYSDVDLETMRKLIMDQVTSWNVRYSSDAPELQGRTFQPRLVTEADSPLPNKINKLPSLTLFIVKFFGGNLLVIAESFQINRLSGHACTETLSGPRAATSASHRRITQVCLLFMTSPLALRSGLAAYQTPNERS